jgi:hypothetical protein
MERGNSTNSTATFNPFNRFVNRIHELQEEDDAIYPVEEEDASMNGLADIVQIISIVFQVILSSDSESSSAAYVLAVLSAYDRVDVLALEEAIWMDSQQPRPTVKLAEHVEKICGFIPGTVSFLGLTPPPRSTVVEELLLEHDEELYLQGGGGKHGF